MHKLTISIKRKDTREVTKTEETFYSIYNLNRRKFEIEDKNETDHRCIYSTETEMQT